MIHFFVFQLSLLLFVSFSAFSALACKKAAHLAYPVQSNDLSIIAQPLATTHSTGEALGRTRKAGGEGGRKKSNGNNQCYYI